jgi:hypothetical protein
MRSARILLFLTPFFLASNAGAAVRSLPQDDLKYPVLVLRENAAASGFIADDGKSIYLVTAKHFLFDEAGKPLAKKAELVAYTRARGFSGQVRLELDLEKLFAAGTLKPHASKDACVARLGTLEGEKERLTFRLGDGVRPVSQTGDENAAFVGVDLKRAIRKYEDVEIGEDVFIFGYPASIGIKNVPQVDHERPLLRKGILAGKNDKLGSLVLDCPSYYGNSGGPVVYVEHGGAEPDRFWVVGIVSEFVPVEETWLNLNRQYTNVNIENSGYTIVVPMDPILELIGSFGDDRAAAKKT